MKIPKSVTKLRELGNINATTFEIHLDRKRKTSPSVSPKPENMEAAAGISGSFGSSSNSDMRALPQTTLAPQVAARSESYGLFGVDTLLLPFAAVWPQEGYYGQRALQVPKLLVLLRQAMLGNDGLRVEGIFRLGGSESIMKSVSTAISRNLFDPEVLYTLDRIDYVHSLATVLKRWYNSLSPPIFQILDLTNFDGPCMSAVLRKLPQPSLDISLWLIAFIAELSTFHQYNGLTPSNLAFSFAPLVTHIPTDNMLIGVEKTKHVTQFLQRLVEERLERASWEIDACPLKYIRGEIPIQSSTSVEMSLAIPRRGIANYSFSS